MTILEEIFRHKRSEVAEQKRIRPLAGVRAEAESAPRAVDFRAAILRPPGAPARLVAEIKRASPSRGSLAPSLDPLRLARIYADNGAAAISVLTDQRYFHGSLGDLFQVAALGLGLPLLRKDFLCDPYQVYEARATGASAVLLIAAGLETAQLRDLHTLALELGLAALVEVHTLEELEQALAIVPRLVGINNRNLHDFSVRLGTSLDLRRRVPPGIGVIAESGIQTPEDAARLAAAGVDALLVGEALVTAEDVGAQVRAFAGVAQR